LEASAPAAAAAEPPQPERHAVHTGDTGLAGGFIVFGKFENYREKIHSLSPSYFIFKIKDEIHY
jgi:hypothetical protein